MTKVSLATLLVGLAVFAVGCSKTSAPEPPAARHAKTSHFNSDYKTGSRVDDSLTETERAIELQAQRAKQDIDEVTAQAESALRKNQQSITAKAKARSRELSEYSAELTEEAKDRAEDVPEAVDDAAASITNRISRGLRSAEQRLQDARERLSEEDTDADRR